MEDKVLNSHHAVSRMKNILVTVDFEDETSVLVENSIQLAQAFGSKVWILHITAPEPDFVGYRVGPQYIRDVRAEELRKEHKLIHQYTDQMKRLGIDADGLLIQGATAEMILNETVNLNIDLLIIGRRKHGFFGKLFGDNIVSTIIEKAEVPVLLIPFNKTD
jgi:nucleotide-binding universal stress UspA family protein